MCDLRESNQHRPTVAIYMLHTHLDNPIYKTYEKQKWIRDTVSCFTRFRLFTNSTGQRQVQNVTERRQAQRQSS